MARGAEWSGVAKSLADRLAPLPGGANLGFLYVTSHLAGGLSSILTFLRQVTGIEDWAGAVGAGVLCGRDEAHSEPAASVMVCAMPKGGHAVYPAIRQSVRELSADTRSWLGGGAAPLVVAHGDPMSGRLADLLGELGDETSGFLVGGLSASRARAFEAAGDSPAGGVSGVMFSGDIEVATGLSQGCAPLAEPRMVTEASNNVIMSIEGRPALDAMKEDIGELLARDLNRAAGYIHAAFPVPGSDTRDYLVRNLMGADTDRGWIAVGGRVDRGDRIMFVRRDPAAARRDLDEMVDGLKARLPSGPRGGLYFSCVARGPNMFGRSGTEMERIAGKLGDVPMVGFYGNGEISGGRLYGYTGVLVLFL